MSPWKVAQIRSYAIFTASTLFDIPELSIWKLVIKRQTLRMPIQNFNKETKQKKLRIKNIHGWQFTVTRE